MNGSSAASKSSGQRLRPSLIVAARISFTALGVWLWWWGVSHWPRLPRPYGPGFWAWALSFMVLVLAWAAPGRWKLLRITRGGWLALAIFVIAGGLRFYQVESVPFAINADEDHGLRALNAMAQGQAENIFGSYDWWVRDPTLSLAPEYLLAFLAPNRFAANRYAAATFGTLSIVATYLLARRLESATVALVASVMLTCSYWHVVASRFQSFYMQPPFATAVIWWGLVRAMNGRAVDAIVTGLLLGLGLQLYTPARIIVPAVSIWWLWHACVTRGFARRTAALLALIIMVAVMVLTPGLQQNGWQPYLGRGQEVTVLSASFREQLFQDGVLQGLLGQTVRLSSVVTGGAQLAMNWFSRAPLLNVAEIGAAMAGLLVCIWSCRSWQYTIAPIWLGLTLGAVWLSSAPEASYRLLVALPALAILVGMGIVVPMRHVYARLPPMGRRGIVLAVVALIAYHVTVNGTRALAYLSSTAEARPWDALGRAIAAGPAHSVYYVERMPQDFGQLPFQALLSKRFALNVPSFVNQVPFIVDPRPPAVFATMQGDSLAYLRQVYPNALQRNVMAPNGALQGRLLIVEPDQTVVASQWHCGLERCGNGLSIDRVVAYWDVQQLRCPVDGSGVRWRGTIDIPDVLPVELGFSQGYLVTSVRLDGAEVVVKTIAPHVTVPMSLAPGQHDITIATWPRDSGAAHFFLLWRLGDQAELKTIPCAALAPSYGL